MHHKCHFEKQPSKFFTHLFCEMYKISMNIYFNFSKNTFQSKYMCILCMCVPINELQKNNIRNGSVMIDDRIIGIPLQKNVFRQKCVCSQVLHATNLSEEGHANKLKIFFKEVEGVSRCLREQRDLFVWRHIAVCQKKKNVFFSLSKNQHHPFIRLNASIISIKT